MGNPVTQLPNVLILMAPDGNRFTLKSQVRQKSGRPDQLCKTAAIAMIRRTGCKSPQESENKIRQSVDCWSVRLRG